MLAKESHGPNEVSALMMKGKGPEISRTHGLTFHSPITGKNLRIGRSSGKDIRLENNGLEIIGMSSKSAIKGSGRKQRSRPWCEHCRKPGYKENTF